MIRGYFKLVRNDAQTARKMTELIEAGAASGNIFFEPSGFKELNRLVGALRKGDTMLVSRAADICSSKTELAELIEKLHRKGAALKAIDEPWLDFMPKGEAVRGTAASSYQEGKPAGRPKGPRREIIQKLGYAMRLYNAAEHLSVNEICETVKLNERTFYRHLKRQGVQVIRRPKGRKPKGIKG